MNSLPINPTEKLQLINDAKDRIYEAQVTQVYKQDSKAFEHDINVSYKNVSKPKDANSVASRIDAAGERELSVADNIADSTIKPSPYDGWNKLDSHKRRALLERLTNRENSINRKKKTELDRRVKQWEILLDKGVVPDDMNVDLDTCISVYGVEHGSSIYELLDLKKHIAPDVANIKTMPSMEAKKFFEEVSHKSKDATLYPAASQKLLLHHETLRKAHKESMDHLQKDPHGWAIEHKWMDPLRFDDPASLGDAMASRMGACNRMYRVFGIKCTAFSKADEELLLKQLSNSSSDEFTGLIGKIWDKTNDADKGALLGSFHSMGDPALATIGSLLSENHQDATHAANIIARGAKHRKDIEHQVQIATHSNLKLMEDKILKEVNKLYSNGETSLEVPNASAEKEARAIGHYIAGEMHKSGDYSVAHIDKRIAQALQEVVGGTPIPVQGCTLRPIRGMPVDEFQDTLKAVTRHKLEKMGTKGKASLPEYYGYINLGEGRYLLTQSRILVRDEKGNNIVIDMKNIPEDVISKMVEEKRKLEAECNRTKEMLGSGTSGLYMP